MSRETSDPIIECQNENPVAMCDEAEPAAKGCTCCKYGTVSSLDHGLVVTTLQEEITFLKNRLRTGTLGGEGSHWKGCEETHIDCARKVMERLRAEVECLESKIAEAVRNFEKADDMHDDCCSSMQKAMRILDEGLRSGELDGTSLSVNNAYAVLKQGIKGGCDASALKKENERLKAKLGRAERVLQEAVPYCPTGLQQNIDALADLSPADEVAGAEKDGGGDDA